MRLERFDANDRTYAAKHILLALFRFQKIANHHYHWAIDGVIFKGFSQF